MITVRGVVERVGPTLLHVLVPPDTTRDASDRAKVSDVVIAEPGNTTPFAAGDLVLGVATVTADEARRLLGQCAKRQVAAVLLKPPAAAAASVRRAARSAGVGLVGVQASTSWAQLVWLLRTVLDVAADESDAAAEGHPQDPTGLGDLFRLADAAAAVVDAPVTIEDANSRVLAYSARQDRTDPARVSTIMGRRVPDDVLARFRSRGVFRQLSRGRSTIFVPAQPDGTLPRLIVPIRIGGELLGSMWAVVEEPVAEDRLAAFADSGPVVALHLLRRRAAVDARRKRSADAVRALLHGHSSPRVAAAELGLGEEPHRVLAIAAGVDDPDAEGVRLALAERLTNGLGAGIAVAEENEVLYAVVPATAVPETAFGHHGAAGAYVSAGAPAPIGELPGSRRQADETLGLLRAGILTGPTARYENVWPQLALHRMATAALPAAAAEPGPLAELRNQDAAGGTDYATTLYHWLRHPADPRAASAALSIHPNTLRYRIRRVGELTGVDLDDPDVRLALLAQLTTLRWS